MPALTPNYGWNLPLVNDPTDEDQWGGLLNENISDQDTLIKSIQDTTSVANGGELTIATGVITVTTNYHTVDTEGDAATDDLVTINGGVTDRVLLIRPAANGRLVVVKNTGNIKVPADITLNGVIDALLLKFDGTNWNQIAATPRQGQKADTSVQITPIISKKFVSTDQTITAAGLLTLPHGLAGVPEFCQFFLKCTTANVGYAVDDVVQWGTVQYSNPSIDVQRGFSNYSDATNVYVKFGIDNPTFTLIRKDTGAIDNITNASWKLIVKAYA